MASSASARRSTNASLKRKMPRAAGIIAAQFNTISPENVMKWEVIHPRVDGYNFGPADEYVAFGQKYKMFIVGHNLVWHSQVPRWVFQDEKGAPLTRDALLAAHEGTYHYRGHAL